MCSHSVCIYNTIHAIMMASRQQTIYFPLYNLLFPSPSVCLLFEGALIMLMSSRGGQASLPAERRHSLLHIFTRALTFRRLWLFLCFFHKVKKRFIVRKRWWNVENLDNNWHDWPVGFYLILYVRIHGELCFRWQCSLCLNKTRYLNKCIC